MSTDPRPVGPTGPAHDDGRFAQPPVHVAPPESGGGGPSWRRRGLKILAAVVVAAVVIGFAMMVLSGGGRDIDPVAARSQCEAGDMAACDDLLQAAGRGTPDEDFALTCGDRRAAPAAALVLGSFQLRPGGSCASWDGAE